MVLTAEQRRGLNRKRRDINAEAAYDLILGRELGAENVGAAVSRKEREETRQLATAGLRYGECGLPALQAALRKIEDRFGEKTGRLQDDGEGVFYDLGSGTGKALLAAAVCYPFEAVVGIEVLEGLHTMATALKARYDERAAEALPPTQRATGAAPFDVAEMELRHGNFAEADLSEADVAFCHCSAFDKGELKELLECLKGLAPGAFAITTTHMLPESAFDTVDNDILEMDGVPVLVFIAVRVESGDG